MNLIAKLTLAVSVVLLSVMAPFFYLNVRTMQGTLFEQAVSAADNLSETIIKTTHYQMLEDDRARVYQMIEEAGKQEDIEHIRMITKDGRIIFSTDPLEAGHILDKHAAACDMCHSGEKPLTDVPTMSRARVFTNERGEQVLGITKAIYNEESCSSAPCHFHPRDQKILGVLDTIVSLRRMREQVDAYTRRLVVLTLLMLVAIAASLTVLVHRLVHRPMREILGLTRKVADLEFDQTVSIRSRDEFGELARAFNDMTRKLAAARAQIEEWTHTLEKRVAERTEEIQRMQAQLARSEKLASLGGLVAGIAHELNNPLTGVLVLASLMEKDPKLDPELREDVASIVHETQRCARIVRGLLDFSRESVPRKQPCNLNDVLESSLTLVGNQALFHDVTVHRRYDPGLPEVMADAQQMEQVFVNMLVNAAQAMEGGGELTLETSVRDGQVLVRIADTGPGIPPGVLGRIFDPFFTTKETRGTGLGLSVSYGIVQNHGGTIEVESEVGVGTAFTIRIPLDNPAQAPAPPQAGAA